jgi:hypothetical protein
MTSTFLHTFEPISANPVTGPTVDIVLTGNARDFAGIEIINPLQGGP